MFHKCVFLQHFIMNPYVIVMSLVFFNFVNCRDFYVGMFKKNDLLVAQDRLYKERVPYRHMYAKYGRIFNCKITYFRIADRLGFGPGPTTQIVRGGLNHKYVVLRLTSPYNMPISVNIYVGCANTFKTTLAVTKAKKEENTGARTETAKLDDLNTTTATDSTNSTGDATEESTTAPA